MDSFYDIIILGGGFGGLHCALSLSKFKGKVLLVDKNNYHLFKPLLYQIAAGALSPAKIADSFREILRHQKNTYVLMDEVKKINKNEKYIETSENKIFFKKLVVALGNKQSFFGNSSWKEKTLGLSSLDDALRLRAKIYQSYEQAENCHDDRRIEELLNFVVVGGGPTGVELAGAISEIANETLKNDFRYICPKKTKVTVLEAGDYILGQYDPETSKKAKLFLEELGVEVLTSTKVEKIDKGEVYFSEGTIKSANIFWAAGNQGQDVCRHLSNEMTKDGKIKVNQDLTIKESDDVFVIGDASYLEENGKPLPALAPVAMQQGKFVADKLMGKEKDKSFHYFDKGSLATIGKSKAVGEIRKLKLHGFFAWLIWSVVHLYYLILSRDRFFVFTTWVYHYFTSERGSRIILERYRKTPLRGDTH